MEPDKRGAQIGTSGVWPVTTHVVAVVGVEVRVGVCHSEVSRADEE